MTVTRDQYDAAFEVERARSYPQVDAFERELGYAVDRERLESAARVLACPVKVNPPCWQHGRVVYAAMRDYLQRSGMQRLTALDLGTAKGFSALCALWAVQDHGAAVELHSVDVIDPAARVRRNTVAEVDGLKTLFETVAPWPESRGVRFTCARGDTWLALRRDRVHFAFIDGKHTYDAVSRELGSLVNLQNRGDVVVADDMQVPGVERAVREVRGYKKTVVRALENRIYCVMVRD